MLSMLTLLSVCDFKEVAEDNEEVAVKKKKTCFFLQVQNSSAQFGRHYPVKFCVPHSKYTALKWTAFNYTERKYVLRRGTPEPSPESKLRISSPSLWTFLRVTEGVEMAEARKLAGNVSEESEVTPRRSFSLNIFLHEGDRVNVLVPSCGDIEKTLAITPQSPDCLFQGLIHYA